MRTRRVGEIMIPLDEYPHIPDQYTLAQAMMEMDRAKIVAGDRRSLPRLLLVFDRNNQMVGIVRRRDLLRGLEPEFLRSKPRDEHGRVIRVEVDPNLLELTSDRIIEGMQQRARESVRSVMIKKVITINYDDHIMKAIDIIVKRDITSLPVLKDNEVVGVVRTVELFHEVSKLVL